MMHSQEWGPSMERNSQDQITEKWRNKTEQIKTMLTNACYDCKVLRTSLRVPKAIANSSLPSDGSPEESWNLQQPHHCVPLGSLSTDSLTCVSWSKILSGEAKSRSIESSAWDPDSSEPAASNHVHSIDRVLERLKLLSHSFPRTAV